MHDTMKKSRHKTPSSAKRAWSARGADEGECDAKDRWFGRRITGLVPRLFRDELLTSEVLADLQ
jgi:hypothetical protein